MDKKLRFLFWNICKRPENIELITQYGRSINADVIAICENASAIRYEINGYYVVAHKYRGLEFDILARPGLNITYNFEHNHFCLAFIEGEPSLHIAIVHFPSQLYTSSKSNRITVIRNLLEELKKQEIKAKSNNSIILGDFNVNPLDEMLTDFNYLNSVNFKCSIGIGSCIQEGEQKDIFYSPMIHILRDSEDACVPKGSYFYRNRWHCYDQVIMKKSVAEQVDYNSVQFVGMFNEATRLVENNRINKSISDHLPLYFELDSKEAKI